MSSPVAFSPLGMISGAVAGIGTALLLQQYGVRPMTTTLLVGGIVAGILVGVATPSLARAVARPRGDRPTPDVPADGPHFCGACGGPLQPGVGFCGSCGWVVPAGNATTPAPAPPPVAAPPPPAPAPPSGS